MPSARELDPESQFQCRKLSKLEPCLQWPSRLVHPPIQTPAHYAMGGLLVYGLLDRRLRSTWTIWPSDFSIIRSSSSGLIAFRKACRSMRSLCRRGSSRLHYAQRHGGNSAPPRGSPSARKGRPNFRGPVKIPAHRVPLALPRPQQLRTRACAAPEANTLGAVESIPAWPNPVRVRMNW